MRRTILLLPPLLWACAGGEDPDEGKKKGGGDGPAAFDWAELEPVLGIANLDDDDEDDERDWEQSSRTDEDDDLAEWVLPEEMLAQLTDGDSLVLSLDGDTEEIRVWVDEDLLLDEDTTEVELASDDLPEALFIEFAGFLNQGTIELVHVDADGATVNEGSISLTSAPLILNHHLMPTEEVWVVNVGGGNADFREGFEDVLGDDFYSVGGQSVGYDVWIQDEIEFSTLTAPGMRMDVIVDSIRSTGGRYLDSFPEEYLQSPGTAVETWGNSGATSQDSFGNLEVSPPVTVDGVHYPFGRAYWGEFRNKGITSRLADMLEEQQVQAPFQLDVTWLCVGHVDEFISWVPDPSSEKGYKLILADTARGYEFLETLDGSTDLPRYNNSHGYGSIDEILDDNALRALNEDLQVDYIDTNKTILMAELGLEESDIIYMPAVFEEIGWCGGATLSLIPGTVNMSVNEIDGTTHLFMPDPFLRSNTNLVSSDPLIAEVEGFMPEGLEFHWLDDWSTYHTQMGEVHCGSNTRRTPIAEWWTEAQHLLGGE